MKHKFFFTLLLLPLMVLAQDISYPGDPFEKETKPPLSARKIMGELGAGVTGGLLAGVIGVTAGFLFFNGDRDATITAVHIAYPIGAAIGASIVGNRGDENGSFYAALGLSVAFAGVTYLAYPVIPENLHTYAYLLAAPVGAVLGHHLTRSYDQPVYNALLQMRSGRLTLGIPAALPAMYPSGMHNLQWRLIDLHF